MTSYMYNPSKQVTSLLSEYLEFDKEQLQLGIWSGKLALKDVNLKADAVYPHLNQFLAESEKPDNEFTKARPPAHVKLVSGSIGELNLDIPWKSLVWGQGDVKVELRNIVVVVALESFEETENRKRGEKSKEPSEKLSVKAGEIDKDDQLEIDPAARARKRYQKQKLLREAERRQLQGRSITGWLERIYKKEEEERQKEALRVGDVLKKQEGKMQSWLQGATNDFFWRFFTGLQAKIENLKIIVVQDSVEMGVIIPSIQLLAGKQAQIALKTKDYVSTGQNEDDITSHGDGSNSRSLAVSSKPPTNVVYESAYDDGEHMDKHIKILGLGVYVRKVSNKKKVDEKNEYPSERTQGDLNMVHLADVSTKEYVLRPTELNVGFSLFYPYPPEKRKKKKERIEASLDQNADSASTASPSVMTQSTSSTKRRRGKREKSSVATKSSSEPPTEPTTPSVDQSSSAGASKQSGPINRGAPKTDDEDSMPVPTPAKPKKSFVMRRMSIQTGARKHMAQPITSARPEISPAPPGEAASDSRSGAMTMATQPTEQSTDSPHRHPQHGTQPRQAPLSGDGGQMHQPRSRFARRSSIAGPVKGSTAAGSVVSRVPKSEQKMVKKSAPLARRDDLSSAFSVASASDQKDLTARLDSEVQVGPVEVMISKKHYNLIDNFLSAADRMRNGRPSKTIASALASGGTGVRHSFQVSASELARATSVTTLEAQPVKLDLVQPRSERSQIVRSWWRYGLYAIRWEIKQRRKVRKHFQDKYLSFNWARQRYRRKEYVSMYIAAKLLSPEEDGAEATNSAVLEALMSIEDDLNIEQILLYRSIARTLHVSGVKEMPDSLISLRTSRSYRERLTFEGSHLPSQSHQSVSRSTSYSSDGEGRIRPLMNSEHDRTLLAMLEEGCEISRMRIESGHEAILPRHRALVKYNVFEQKQHGMEESTVGMTLDTRSGARGGNGFSRGGRTRSTRSSSSESEADASMKFSLNASFERVQLNVVEEEVSMDGYKQRAEEDESSRPSMSASDISELTDDDRFSENVSQSAGIIDDESRASDPILQSTDFLLFRRPEKIILKTEIRTISLSALGSAAGSRNLNFKIGRVEASGPKCKLLEVGSDGDGSAGSDSAIGDQSVGDSDNAENQAVTNALSLSLVLQKENHVLQCDVAPMKFLFDYETVQGLFSFGDSFQSSRPLLPTTAGESVRTYVIQQNMGSSFRFIDASFRLHGFQVALPQQKMKEDSDSDGEMMESGSGTNPPTITQGLFVAEMIEIYSGRSANELGVVKPHWQEYHKRLSVLGEDGDHRHSSKTRQLQMLDVDELITQKSAFLAFNVVAAVSGLDFVLSSKIEEGIEEQRLSMLEKPVDIELFSSMNESSVLDYNRAKQEVVVRVSDIHTMISESRLELLSDVIPRATSQPNTINSIPMDTEKLPSPPRLEILARLMMTSIDLNVARLRFSLMTDDKGRVGHSIFSKRQQLVDFVTAFLRTVGKLDLSWPHEEALSSAMQICIDRLTGIGFQLDDAWQCANTSLLNFLEDIADMESNTTDKSEDDALDALIHSSVSRTAELFVDRINYDADNGQMVENHLVMDLPDGFQMNSIDLFYDRHIALVVKSLFITNGEGIHLLRLMPEVDQSDDSGKGDSDAKSDAAASYDDSFSESTKSSPAFIFRLFKSNESFSFGRGGLPLSALGGEIEDSTTLRQQTIRDLDMGELELLFCEEVYDDILYAVSQLTEQLNSFVPKTVPQKGETYNAPRSRDNFITHTLINSACVSLLFTNEDLIPFTRVIFGNFVSTTNSENATPPAPTEMSAKQISLLYLAPDGELYPEQLCSHDMSSGPPLSIYSQPLADGSSKTSIELRGTRMFMVYQYVAECYQYFYSGTIGLSLWLSKSSDVFAKLTTDESEKQASSSEVVVNLRECSLLIPRSSLSSEMVAFEIDEARISFDEPASSFQMPSDESFLDLTSSQNESTKEEISQNTLDISRTIVEMNKFRVFTSMVESNDHRNPDDYDVRETLAFNCFFEIDGRAEPNKKVYHQIAQPQNYEIEREKADRRWREVTNEALSLKVFADYAPHLRILVTDDVGDAKSGFGLDVTLSQFCLLMSCYYSNMSELPAMFPYSATDIEVGATFLADPLTFAEFGTEEYRDNLEELHPATSEFCMSVSRFYLRCTTDRPFETVTSEANGVLLGFDTCSLHVLSDKIGLTKVGLGALRAQLVDDEKVNTKIVDVQNRKGLKHSWADLSFGTGKGCTKFIDDLPLPFQMSVYFSPKASLYNLGMDSSIMTMADFSTMFSLLGFTSVYFCEAELGYPFLRAVDFLKKTKDGMLGGEEEEQTPPDSLTDFRLWLSRPQIRIPIEPAENSTSYLILASEKGIWYRCATIDLFLSQESIVRGLTMSFVDKEDAGNSTLLPLAETLKAGKSLVEGLSLGIRIDFNGAKNHSDYSLKIPYTGEWDCDITSPRISVDPVIVPMPSICKPVESADRFLGPTVCEMTLVIDIIPVAYAALYNLFVGAVEEEGSRDGESQSQRSGQEDVASVAEEATSSAGGSDSVESLDDATYSFTGALGDIRIYALDPILGPHLPVSVLSISSLRVTASQFSLGKEDVSVVRGQSPPQDQQIYIQAHVWADSFKLGLTRSWEPLVEAYKPVLLYEDSSSRGSGLTLISDTPLHMNISGATLLVIDEVADSMMMVFAETFGEKPNHDQKTHHGSSRSRNLSEKCATFSEEFASGSLVHELPRSLSQEDRVAFAVKNMTGQRMRVFRFSRGNETSTETATVYYVDNEKATKLAFQPSVSRVTNMQVAEVEFPGLENSPTHNIGGSGGTAHVVDIQVPGFEWVRGVQIDNFGRHFVRMMPRSRLIREKIKENWRIRNVMNLLVEVGLENGGRELTVNSIFSILNKTTHSLSLILHPNPSFSPESANKTDVELGTGCAHQIPVLLLESALRNSGASELGCIWLRPNSGKLPSLLGVDDVSKQNFVAEFSSRPLKLNKMVNDSALLFEESKGADIPPDGAETGVQVSCPVIGGSGERELAPFCYAVEVNRSPIVKTQHESQRKMDKKETAYVHGPVAYTLSVYAPFVIVNLLPQAGRFELMHAVRKTILWFADLEPGQQVSIHSVGLDAPLLLLINLRFCRTPIGEGALVHHGVDPPPDAREHLSRLRSIGKAGKAVTKHLGKTLTSLGDSPDKRGQDRLFEARQKDNQVDHANHYTRKVTKVSAGDAEIEDVDGKTYRVDTTIFFPENCVDETALVDGVGQRLTLGIENLRGGGGQRRISVFCPFWVINTTEHALIYRQERSKNYVSGTVVNKTMNGSLTLSGGHIGGSPGKLFLPQAALGSRRAYQERNIFAGTPGALATSSGRCNLSPGELSRLLEEDLNLEDLSRLAFMFNFHEGSTPGGYQKLCVQLHDGMGNGRYESEWSRGFTLDSVGISQVVDMGCKDARALELTMVTQNAPGHLFNYTKIIRFLPRYVVVNNLPYPVRLWQDNSIFRPPSAADVTLVNSGKKGSRRWRIAEKKRRKEGKVNQYEALWGREVDIAADEANFHFPQGTTAHPSALYISSIPPSSWKPFNLPDTRGDRQLRVGLGGYYNLTSSISADVPGEHALRITRAIDLRLLKHVSTRASPEYSITLPPRGGIKFSGELGIWFETEWGTDRCLIVKAIRHDSFCYDKTDVHIGDELLLIDGAPVSRMTFSEAMSVLRNRISAIKEQKEEVLPSRRPAANLARRASLSFNLSGRFSSSQVVESETKSEETIRSKANPLTLTFRTVEERLRRVRLKAARTSAANDQLNRDAASNTELTSSENDGEPVFMKAELKTLHKSMYLVLGSIGTVPYEIHNRSRNSTMYFRQRGCHNHPWRVLKPGSFEMYCWEEPMKAKRLTVRVATEDSFVFALQSDEDDLDDSALEGNETARSIVGDTARNMAQGLSASKKKKNKRVKDEEDSEFSQSVSVRLEEIGFKDFLRYRASNNLHKNLELEVDVVGSTRVLVVRDLSTEMDSEAQLMNHLNTLRNKCSEEEERIQHLRSLRSQLPSIQSGEDIAEEELASPSAIMDAARILVHDFPEEKTITRCHQMVVEVLEATGLSPDNYVGQCNPFVEIYLKKGSGRRNLFQRNKSQRTYYVRRSVNPQWNSQSFVFDVPAEAVSVTRGHAVKVKVRNFRGLANHPILGRAQIDLHSVRGHNPLVGWFPLAGRTGRRELENSLSHWGRGSIKLKIYWVHSPSSLVDYFLMLSECRLNDLTASIEGIGNQVEKWREEELKRKERVDGFKAVRVNDLVSSQKRVSTPSTFQNSIMKKESMHSKKEENESDDQQGQDSTKSGLPEEMSPQSHFYGMAASMKQDVEDQISMRRQQLLQMSSVMAQSKRLSSLHLSAAAAIEGTATISAFRSWEEAKVFFNDRSLDLNFDGEEWVVKMNGRSIAASEEMAGSTQLAGRLTIPTQAPTLIRKAADEYATSFAKSRASIERFARSSLQAALNPGGWLTIRPIQALNLPDTYSGMFVRVKYGAETLTSETVDSTVYPTWFDPNQGVEGTAASPDSLEYFTGDLHLYVPPQKTSGTIFISVLGEGQGQRMTTKTELGVLAIPLGDAITSCIDSIECYIDNNASGRASSSPVYMKWFPLEDPKKTRPFIGDRRTSSRPRETEKESDHTFNDYFSPCIQLGLFWNPETEQGTTQEDQTERNLEQNPLDDSRVSDVDFFARPQEKMVDQYIKANIGQISFALIDSRKGAELVSGCICDVDARYWVTKAKTRFGIAFGWFQLDQQDEYCREPVILAPTPSEFVSTVFQILAVKDNLRSKNDVLSFEFIDFSLAEFDLTLEEMLLADIADFLGSLRLRGALSSRSSHIENAAEELSTISSERSLFDLGNKPERDPESSLLHILAGGFEEIKGRQRVYIEQLFLGVVKFNLSYLKGTKETRVLDDPIGDLTGRLDLEKRKRHAKADIFASWSQNTEQHHGGSFTLPTIFTSLFPNVSDAPVRLQGKALNHVFESPGEIIQSIRKFYVNETLKQIYKIIGSLDFVGNPTMLFTSFLSGLRDLIIIPSQAFIKDKNASSVGIGVAKGTLSLFSHSASGFFGFTSKIFAVAGQALASASCDKDFRKWHREQVLVEATNLNRTWKRRGVQSAQQMLVRPLGDILVGLGSGVTGIIVSPIRGYRKNGVTGLLTGVAAGIVGVIVRPTVGVLDALSHFTASIHDIAKSVNVLEKRFAPAIKYRLPYVFGTNLILMGFDESFCRAAHLLKKFPLKSRRKNSLGPEILIHVEVLKNVGIDTFSIVTNLRLIIIRLVHGSNAPTLCWQVSTTGKAKVSSQVAEHGHNGFALTVFLKEKERDKNNDNTADAIVNDSLSIPNESGVESDALEGQSSLDSVFEPVTEEFDHGTSRSEAGEIITWYSVVAEYQYRRQLARLHNAICCVTDNFESIILDPTLGRPGSTQFYTSFGIYNFEHVEGNDTKSISTNPFEELMEAIPWRLDEEVVSDDPAWLVTARRRAANATIDLSRPVETETEDSALSSANATLPSGRVRKIARWITGRLPTIVDAEDYGPSSPEPVDLQKNTSAGKESVSFHPDVSELPSSETSGVDQKKSTGEETFVTAPELETSELSRLSMASAGDDTFLTAPEAITEAPSSSVVGPNRDQIKFSENSPLVSNRDRGESFCTATPFGAPESCDDSPRVEDSNDASLDSVEKLPFISPPLKKTERGISDQTTMHSNRSESFSIVKDLKKRVEPSSDERLARMENIMEQLLVFSSEQALQNVEMRTPRRDKHGHATNEDVLEREVHELRRRVQEQQKAEEIAQKELQFLRREVKHLANMVKSGSHQSSNSDLEGEIVFDEEENDSAR